MHEHYKEPTGNSAAYVCVDDLSQIAKSDAGKPKLSLVPMQIVSDIAVIREYGNNKYGDKGSWKTVAPQRYIDAMLRHAIAFAENPLSVDEESGLPNLWHLSCNCAFLAEFYKRGDLK